MEKNKESLINWVKKHKKALVIAGVSIGALIVTIICLKNQKAIDILWKSLKQSTNQKSVKPNNSTFEPVKAVIEKSDALNDILDNSITAMHKAPHDVSGHFRNLPEGYTASAEKLAIAAERGITLLPGQTFVDPYKTRGIVA